MKKFCFGLLALSFMTVASAEVYQCEGEKVDYLLSLNEKSGIIYTNENGYFKELEGSVKVARAMDGGPVSVMFSRAKDADTDFSNRCFVFGEAHINFTVKTKSYGDAGSSLQLLPNIIVDPAQRNTCSIPRVMIGRPQSIKCSLL